MCWAYIRKYKTLLKTSEESKQMIKPSKHVNKNIVQYKGMNFPEIYEADSNSAKI